MRRFVLQNPGSAAVLLIPNRVVSRAASLTIEHDRAETEVSLHDFAHVPSLLLELSHGAYLGCFVGVNQSSRHFDHDGVDRRTPLLLQKYARGSIWVRGILQDCQDAYAVDV